MIKQKKIEKELRQQKDFLNTLLETIPSPIFYKDADGKYTGCNCAFEEFIGLSRSQIIGRTVFDMGPEYIASQYHKKDAELITNPGKQRYEWKVMRTDGELRDVIFDKATLHDETGSVTGLVGVVSDITERKHAETLIRDLSQRLIQAQESERKMISCELHDSIAQNLSTLKLYCSRLFEGLPASEPEIKKISTDVATLIDQTITTVRNLAYSLRPAGLDHLGLLHVLETCCEELAQKNDMTVDFQATGIHESTLNSNIRINLYRLVIEGLNNIRKHAAASKATVRLVGAYPDIILRIEDNGCGFDIKKWENSDASEKKMGLRSIMERVSLLQGRMAIRSNPGEGTYIFIKLPLKDKLQWIENTAF